MKVEIRTVDHEKTTMTMSISADELFDMLKINKVNTICDLDSKKLVFVDKIVSVRAFEDDAEYEEHQEKTALAKVLFGAL